jgi:hypothetical protein
LRRRPLAVPAITLIGSKPINDDTTVETVVSWVAGPLPRLNDVEGLLGEAVPHLPLQRHVLEGP